MVENMKKIISLTCILLTIVLFVNSCTIYDDFPYETSTTRVVYHYDTWYSYPRYYHKSTHHNHKPKHHNNNNHRYNNHKGYDRKPDGVGHKRPNVREGSKTTRHSTTRRYGR